MRNERSAALIPNLKTMMTDSQPKSFIVIGASSGGLSALQILLAGLPKNFAVPIAIVLHRGREVDNGGFVEVLAAVTPMPVAEPDDNAVSEAGHVYLAPADYHLLIEPSRLRLSVDSPVHHARPAIDMLFESAAAAYGGGVVGVLLTGANADGAQGCKRIKALGGVVVVQEPASAASSTMPAAAIAATQVDQVLPLAEIAPWLVSSVAGG